MKPGEYFYLDNPAYLTRSAILQSGTKFPPHEVTVQPVSSQYFMESFEEKIRQIFYYVGEYGIDHSPFYGRWHV